ncbi:hypothetical protein AcV5_005368 [Taiwanofungus camphoratus]|nr:hypothetical protein AcV5_005368 [Antrodia cinnamomea]
MDVYKVTEMRKSCSVYMLADRLHQTYLLMSPRFTWFRWRSRTRNTSSTLPTTKIVDQAQSATSWTLSFSRRRTKIAIAVSISLMVIFVAPIIFGLFASAAFVSDTVLHSLALIKSAPLPPLYSAFHEYELRLPQHSLNLSFPEGQERAYLWIENHEHGVGWGNVMQQLLLNSYLAYRAGRAFVFYNYTWNDSGYDHSLYNWKPIPSRIPLSALIRGPTVGAPLPSGEHAPRAVMKEFWDRVCHTPKVIRNEDVIALLDAESTAGTLLDKWVEVLNVTEDSCVKVPRDSLPIFDMMIMQNADRLLDVWQGFSQSPILTEFGWSPLVELAFDMNRQFFSPLIVFDSYLSSTPFHNNSERYDPLPGLLVLHIRRGDFVRHCKRLAGWGSTYMSYNRFSSLPDKFETPAHMAAEAKSDLYRLHCFPDIEEIVKKTGEVRATDAGQGLKNVYIMTNGPALWVDKLKLALLQTGHWNQVTSSRDLLVNPEQEFVKQAVDMLIGQRAQVFIGNGFSSLTALVVMLRMGNGLDPNSSRFW